MIIIIHYDHTRVILSIVSSQSTEHCVIWSCVDSCLLVWVLLTRLTKVTKISNPTTRVTTIIILIVIILGRYSEN